MFNKKNCTSILQLLVFFALVCFAAGCQKKSDEKESLAVFSTLDSLMEAKDYFTSRRYFDENRNRMTDFHRRVCEANIAHVFNRLADSNELISSIFKDYSTLADSLRFKLLTLKQINHGKLFEYQEAFNAIDEQLTKHSASLSDTERDDMANTRRIWQSLAGQKKQNIVFNGGTTLKIKRDKAGLANLAVNNGHDTVDFIFDTGANFSTVTATMAKQYEMTVMDSVIEVMAITGTPVEAHMAVCPVFYLGPVAVHNAVFLVFPDSALAIPQIDYQIQGIIGFPVIEGLKEVQLTHDDNFIVPEHYSVYPEVNMALDFLTPIMNLNGEYYTFDTGANKTILYQAFFNKHKEKIQAKYTETPVSFGGAGGNISTKGYTITFEPTINGKVVTVDSVRVLTENVLEDANHLYGNVGQDVIRKFNKMTINFESMFIRFE